MLDPANIAAKENIVSCYVELSKYYNTKKNYKGVINSLKGILKYKPEKAPLIKVDLANAYNNYGVTLMNQGKYQKAIENFQKALKVRPDSKVAKENIAYCYINQGVEYHKKGDLIKAKQMFKKAIKAAPGTKAEEIAKNNLAAIKGE